MTVIDFIFLVGVGGSFMNDSLPSVGCNEFLVQDLVIGVEKLCVVNAGLCVQKVEDGIVPEQRLHRLVGEQGVLFEALPLMLQATRRPRKMELSRVFGQQVFELLDLWITDGQKKLTLIC